jgi:hypothetical protein
MNAHQTARSTKGASMKRKDTPKAIDPAVLNKILGGLQTIEDKDKKGAVISQDPFTSFFHS